MGRIDDALRRTANAGFLTDQSATRGGSVFESPWVISPEANLHGPNAAVSYHPEPSTQDVLGRLSPEVTAKLVASPQSDPVLVEQFRRLAGALHQAQSTVTLRSLMVTSAAERDGKTFVALNLALVLARSYGRRVLLIDADLRRPSLDQICGVDAKHGLSESLRAENEEKLTLIPICKGLTLLPAGPPDSDPMSSLTSGRMSTILQEAFEQFDWVILDAPPAAPLADASLLGAIVDGILFVVKARETRYPMVEKALQAVDRNRIIGVVLNNAENVDINEGAYYGNRQTLGSNSP